MKNKKQKNSFKKNIIEWIVWLLIFLIIVIATPKFLTKALNSEYPIASITSSSMWPVIKKGDIIFIKGVDGKNDISIGDIVVYNNPRGFTIHRVVELNEDTFITKGDANNVNDPPVKYEELIGKAVYIKDKPLRIPHLGKLSHIYNK